MIRTDHSLNKKQLRYILESKYQLKDFIISIHNHSLQMTTVTDLNKIIDEISPEEFGVDERFPYWADLWHSAIALSEFLYDNLDMIRGKNVLEIGCGLGLDGIVATMQNARVTFSDNDEDALLFSRYNLMKNANEVYSSHCRFINLDWRDNPLEQWDVILAADVVYEKRFIHPLIQFLQKAIKKDGIILLAEPNRKVGEEFFSLLPDAGFHLDSEERAVDYDNRQVKINIYQMRLNVSNP